MPVFFMWPKTLCGIQPLSFNFELAIVCSAHIAAFGIIIDVTDGPHHGSKVNLTMGLGKRLFGGGEQVAGRQDKLFIKNWRQGSTIQGKYLPSQLTKKNPDVC